MRVSNVDKHTREAELPVRLCNYVDVYKNRRITLSMPFMAATAQEDEVERFRLAEGDVLITKDSEAWDDIGVPSLVVESADDLLSGYHLALLRPFKGMLGAYLAQVLESSAVAYQFHVAARGVTRYGLTYSGIQSVQIPLPPIGEQATIVRYLDWVDRRIRRYVSAKRKLIGLLEEEKQAVINQAVTRGLDPNVRLKPSGVEWLGDVPEHWEVRRLKQVCSRSSLYGANVGATQYEDQGVRFLRTTDISEDGRLLAGGVFLPREIVTGYILSDGDILLSRSGTVGRCFLYSSDLHAECAYAGYLVRFVPNTDVMPRYLFLFTKTGVFSAFLRLMAISSTIENVNADKYANGHLPVPPISEQQAIVEHLDKVTAHSDAVIARARHQIDLIEEYRTRLIADVVTGKLDVREAAARLPDEADGADGTEADDPVEDVAGEFARADAV